MNEHETIRGMLPLAAAGALPPAELRTVEQHTATCPDCSRELAALSLCARTLQELAQPALPAGLLQRTRSRLADRRAAAAERRRQTLTLLSMALFSWAIGIIVWLLVRIATGGVWNVLGMNLADPVTWSLLSALSAWTTAGVVAVALGKRAALF